MPRERSECFGYESGSVIGNLSLRPRKLTDFSEDSVSGGSGGASRVSVGEGGGGFLESLDSGRMVGLDLYHL